MKILGNTDITNEIVQLIKGAQEYLIIISPYIKLESKFKVKLGDAIKRVKYPFFIYREDKDNVDNETLSWLKSFKNLRLFSIKNLHSKIYVNQEFAIITSMNLYEYSQINNHEIGVKIDALKEENEYYDILKEIREIVNSQYENNTFSIILNMNENYTMKRLYDELNESFTFKNFRKNSSSLYEFISGEAMKLIEFEKKELYIDEKAVLRSTNLGKERFEFLKKEIIKIAN